MSIKTLIFVLFLCQNSFSQSKLDELIIKRKQVYLLWKETSEKNSGFFGNKTKEDLNNTNKELLKIIRLDNDILEELKNEDSKKYLDLQEKYNDLSVENTALSNEIKGIKKRLTTEQIYGKNNNKNLERVDGDRILFGSLAFIFGVFLLFYFVKHRSAKKHIRRLINQPKKVE